MQCARFCLHRICAAPVRLHHPSGYTNLLSAECMRLLSQDNLHFVLLFSLLALLYLLQTSAMAIS